MTFLTPCESSTNCERAAKNGDNNDCPHGTPLELTVPRSKAPQPSHMSAANAPAPDNVRIVERYVGHPFNASSQGTISFRLLGEAIFGRPAATPSRMRKPRGPSHPRPQSRRLPARANLKRAHPLAAHCPDGNHDP